ncbi:hypothetical protein QBC45DRAFT_479856 [Copromyces sp. CBS 386.78]|nr:hypothetical protein QBC45DRAFT_479856 [Copromyces sp. CBS 386.78]
MQPQTPTKCTKHVSRQIEKKPETTLPPPTPSQTHLPTPSPSPLSHTRKQQRHHHTHHVRFNLAAVSSRIQISSGSDKPSQSKSSNPSTSSAYLNGSLSGLPTPPRSESTSSPKFTWDSVSLSPSSWSFPEPAARKEETDRRPPCNNCHKPSTLYTVDVLNPKGNAGRKYFACRRCPYGLVWVGWGNDDGVGIMGLPMDSSLVVVEGG